MDDNIFFENIDLSDHDLEHVRRLVLKISLNPMVNDRSFSVIFCDDQYMSDINYRFRGKSGSTDVLSFPEQNDDDFFQDVHAADTLGDIFVSLDRAAIQASEAGTGLAAELERLLVHGILHLLGYDHETSDSDAQIMEKKEEELLALLRSH